MNRWFRFHNEALNDPKVQRLDGDTFKAWVNLLCLASMNDGKLPSLTDVAFALRMTEDGARTVVERLLDATLIDKVSGGVDGWHYAPHGWSERQYKSDTSTDRVKRFRQRSKTVTVTPPDTDTEQNNTVDKSTEAAPSSDKEFWAASKSYLGKSKAGMIGKWVRDYGKERTASAITSAQIERAVDPVPYIERALRNSAQAKQAALRVPI